MADGVDAAIEIKPDISIKAELYKSLTQATTVKKLRRVKGAILLTWDKTPEQLEHSKQIPSFVFSLKAKANIKDTIDEIRTFYKDNAIVKKDQVDYIVILERGLIVNHKYIADTPLRDTASGEKLTGFAFLEYGVDTLAAFLIALNRVPHASASMHGAIIEHYLKDIPNPTNQLAFKDLK
jgi:hypothetical protein